MDLFYIGGVLLKKWYLTLLVPTLIAVGAFYIFNQRHTMEAKYEASSSFIIANKDVGKDDTFTNFKYSGMVVASLAKLVTNTNVIKNALHELDGKTEYTDNQVQYILAPSIKNNTNVLVEDSIVQVTYKNESASRAKKMVNELIRQTRNKERSLWGTDSIKVLEKATTPLNKNTNLRKTLLFTGVAFVVPLVLVSMVIVVFSIRKTS